MRRALYAGLVGIAGWLVLSPGVADAQINCPEGRTASGQCVNARLAEAMRQIGVIYSQPKLSQTAYPVLPVDDRLYRYPNELNPDPLKPSRTTGPTP